MVTLDFGNETYTSRDFFTARIAALQSDMLDAMEACDDMARSLGGEAAGRADALKASVEGAALEAGRFRKWMAEQGFCDEE